MTRREAREIAGASIREHGPDGARRFYAGCTGADSLMGLLDAMDDAGLAYTALPEDVPTMTNSTTDLPAAARGLGRWYRRQRVRRDLAVQYAVTCYPRLTGFEAEIARGWNAERSGR